MKSKFIYKNANTGKLISPFEIAGQIPLKIVSVTAAYQISSDDQLVLVDCTGAAVTVTLPKASENTGKIFRVKKVDSSGNAVTIAPFTTATIDGASTDTIVSQNGLASYTSDGTNWYALDSLSSSGETFSGAIVVAPTNSPLLSVSLTGTISQASANARSIKIAQSFTGAGSGMAGIEVANTFAPSVTSSAQYGYLSDTLCNPGTGVALTNVYGYWSRLRTGSGAGTIGSMYALFVNSPSFGTIKPGTSIGLSVANQGSASITTTIGVDVVAQSGSTTNIGVRIALASTYTLQLSDATGVANGGITFATDVQLYRSAALTLAVTDGIGLNVGTTTGFKLGTATGQKLGFWGVTPVVQQVLATGGGATADNIITLLQTLGLCKQA